MGNKVTASTATQPNSPKRIVKCQTQRARQEKAILVALKGKKDWDVVFRGTVKKKEWKSVEAQLGLDSYQVQCRLGSELCDRDYVCSGYLCVMYRRCKKALHITGYGIEPYSVPVSSPASMQQLMAYTTLQKLLVVAVAENLAVLEVIVGDRKHAFPILDCNSKSIRAVYEPSFLLTLIEGEITPDFSHTGLLLYCQAENSPFFTYDLFLISNKTGELVQRVCLGNGGVQPHFAFHPAYKLPHIAVAHYRNIDYGDDSKLVIMEVKNESVKICSKKHFSLILGSNQLFAKFSPDGRFLLLQKLTDDRFGVTSFCDTYIFDVTENTFDFVKYITNKIPGVFYSCRVSFKPEFSRCGKYMRTLNTARSVEAVVLVLPNCLDLMASCRQVIVASLTSSSQISELPIPNALKNFLMFKPEL